MGNSRGTWRTKLSKYVINNMNLLKKKNIYIAFLILFVSSCQTNQNEIKEIEVNKIGISEDEKFEEYLDVQWDKDLEDRPIFASLLGDKRFNQDITSAVPICPHPISKILLINYY